MAGSDSFNKPHLLDPELTSPIQPNPSKSYYTHFLSKHLLVIFVLVLLPLFPSQAPEFINQTILKKVWELLHLLFIGIAVCYGLFSRRYVEMNTETYSKIDNSQTHLSGILHISSIFEDGSESPCGSDEKRIIPTWNSEYPQSESMAVITNAIENPSGSHEKVTQTWNSQHFQGESRVFVSQENYVLGRSMDYRPLGLPLRSLRSRILDTDTFDSINGSGSSSNQKNSSKSYGKIRNMVPKNLEEEEKKKFKETVVLSSPIPWPSRSSRMEMREKIGTVKLSSHSRPLSVGEFEIESLKWQSFQSSVSSQTSSLPSSSKKSPNLKVEDLERKKSFNGSLEPALNEASPITSKPRRFSIGSSSEMNVKRSFGDVLKIGVKSIREDSWKFY